MEEIKQLNVNESNINDESSVEETVMQPPKKSKFVPLMLIVGIVLGLGTGFFVAKQRLLKASGSTSLTTSATQNLTSSTKVKVGDTFGSADEKTFSDTADGILMAGGIDGEGSHHLIRGANQTQWVYITSSVVDLDLLVGDKVTVWGQTNQGKKAGWLMDVGKLKVLELNAAPSPTDAAGAQPQD